MRPPNVTIEMSGVIELSIGPGPLTGAAVSPAACRAVRGELSGSPRLPRRRDGAHDGVDGVLESIAVGGDDPGVGGRTERRDRPGGIELVATAQGRQDLARLVAGLMQAPLLGTPAGPLLERGVEEDLEVGIRQDHGPDVAAGHDDSAGRREGPLALQQGGSQLGDGGDGRHRSVHGRRVNLGGSVDSVDEDPGEPSRPIGRQLHLGREGAQCVGVARGDRASKGEPGDRPVEQPGVAEPVADLECGGRSDAALAGRAGPVEGDDQLRARSSSAWVVGRHRPQDSRDQSSPVTVSSAVVR